ncbi:hypothetical protein TeGR_g13702 [Tetraparma gracilis]|uniref:Tyrosine-protein kinase ephrin type A/B receptor-like domain-containing protein n=1 Tax=Tetraparma gracilis TaxID=2962635 RepID=A0ABQ6N7T9_9STRA|nr:hypothetical protein TeGR_g13702 [Tetraparma gracilis]
MYVKYSTVTLDECEFTGNTLVLGYAAGLFVDDASDVTVIRTVFRDNVVNSGYGGAIVCNIGAVLELYGVGFSNNEVSEPLKVDSSVHNAFSYFCYTTACPEGEEPFLYDGCVPCTAGSFSDSTSTSPCTPCPEGTYSSATGAIECTGTCPPETPWSPEGTVVPRNCGEPQCAANKYWAESDQQCTSCPPHLETSRAGSMSIAGCFSIRASFFASSMRSERISAFNADESNYKAIADVSFPDGLTFISPTMLIVGNYDEILAFDAEGTPQGVFASLRNTGKAFGGLIYLPDLHLVGVAEWQVNIEVFFFDVHDFDGTPLGLGDVVARTSLPGFNTNPRYLSRGENPDELLATNINYADFGTVVVRFCIPTEATCNPAERNMVLVDGGSDIVGVEVLLEKGTFLVSNRLPSNPGNGRVWECPLDITTTMNIYSCALFAYQPEGDGWEWDPYQIHADDEKGVVYVGDHDYMKIHAFFFDGTYLGRVEEMEGNLGAPTDFTIYEGAFPPLSTLELPDSGVFEAGTDITAPLTLKNHRNVPIGDEYPARPGIYSIEATGLIPGTNYSSTITGSIEYKDDAPSSAALTASLNIPFVGDWTISLTGGNSNPQSFFGSPTTITVFPAPTDPASCTTTSPTVITAGSDFTATVSTFDAFLNPTSHAADTFSFALDDGRPPSSVVRAGTSASVVYSDTMTRAGSYELEVIFHDEEISVSPLNFDVLAAAPSAAASTASAGTTTSIESAVDTALQLQAFLHDEFGNEVFDAPGVVVNIQGLDPLDPAAVVEHVLEGPRYSHTVTVLQDLEATLTISFSLDGAPIGEPLEISVSPPPPPEDPFSANNVIFLAGVFFFGGLGIYYVYAHLTKTANDTSLKTKAKEVRANLFMIAVNVVDVLTDFLNWHITIARACAGLVNHLYLGFACASVVGMLIAVSVSVLQLLHLKSDADEIKTSEELEAEFIPLKARYKKVEAEAEAGGAQVQPVAGDAAAAAEDEDPVNALEKKLLARIERIHTDKTEVFQMQRDQKRTIAGVIQIIVEDTPITFINVLYMVYGCDLGVGAGEPLDTVEDENNCPPVQERVGSVFIFTTMLTVALATKKVVSFRGLGAMKRNRERLEREIKGMEEEAGGWLAELVRKRTGGEEPPAAETRAPESASAEAELRLAAGAEAELRLAADAAASLRAENEGLRRRNVGLAEEGGALRARLEEAEGRERRMIEEKEAAEAGRAELQRQADEEIRVLMAEMEAG